MPKSTTKDLILEAAAFEALLAALDPDRMRAGEKYEEMRVLLIYWFQSRNCYSGPECADDTLDRAARQVLDKNTKGEEVRDIRAFIFGIAKFVLLEYYRIPEFPSDDVVSRALQRILSHDSSGAAEATQDALDGCLEELPRDQRDLILEFYSGEKGEKKEIRVRMAERLKRTMNALYILVYHIRRRLEDCVTRHTDATHSVPPGVKGISGFAT